jgi:hypothetical protein
MTSVNRSDRSTAPAARAARTRRLRFVPLALLLGAAVPLAGCFGLIDQMVGVNTACQLKTTGVAAQAEILSIWETGISVNDEPVIGLRVRVLADDRPPFEADIKHALISFLTVPQFQPGNKVPVVFDPQNPANIGLDIYRCN